MMTLRWGLVLWLLVGGVSRVEGAENWLYWTHTTGIGRVRVDGTEATSALIGGFQIEGVAASAARHRLVWGDVPPTVPIAPSGLLQTSRLDGSGIERLVGQLPHPGAVAWDEVHDLVYWTDLEKSEIMRANADGSGVETVLAARDEIRQLGGIALDPQRDSLVFAYVNPLIDSLFPGAIARLNLGDAQLDNVVSGLSEPKGVALHEGNVYWADNLLGTGGVIGRLLLETGERDVIVKDLKSPVGIAIDPAAEQIYWTDRLAGKLQRAGLDGSNPVDVLSDLEDPSALSIAVPEPAAWLLLLSGIYAWPHAARERSMRRGSPTK
jgi:hypothetical protein